MPDDALLQPEESENVRRAREIREEFDRLQERIAVLQAERAQLLYLLADEGLTTFAVADLFGMSRVNVFKIKERHPRNQ
ncbi:hypothetical protein ACX31A_15455 [Dermacoccus nishinomiyaensis]